MLIRRIALLAPGLAIWIAPALGVPASPPQPARWIPPQAAAVLELRDAGALLDMALEPALLDAITALPGYRELRAQPDVAKLLALVRYLEERLGMEWKGALRELLAGGATLALGPGGTALLIVDAGNGKTLARLCDAARALVRLGAAASDHPDTGEPGEYRGATIWPLGPRAVYTALGQRLLVASERAVLEVALDLRAEPARPSLATLPAYRAASATVAADSIATAFLNLALLKRRPALAKALETSRNPLGALLLGGAAQALRTASWLALELQIEGRTLAVEARSDAGLGEPGSPLAFARPPAQKSGALANLHVPRQVAALSLYRDLHGFYAAKDELFPERTSELIFFENMMGIFFSGRDLTEEVLAHTGPRLRLVVAEQVFDPAIGTPRVQLPAFALVVPLRDRADGDFAKVLEEAWQKALGLINFTRGQQGQPGLIIDRLTQGGTRFTVAAFSTVGIEDREHLEVQFNFRPAIAVHAGALILSSSDGLARDLIDALTAEAGRPPAPLARTDSLLEIDGRALAHLLAINRASLVRQNMVEKGNSQREAELAIDVFIALVRLVNTASLRIDERGGHPRARLCLELALERDR